MRRFNILTIALIAGILPSTSVDAGIGNGVTEVWVANQGSGTICIIDASTLAVTECFLLPAGDVVPPLDIAISTLPDVGGTHAFVTQETWLTVLQVSNRATVAQYLVDDLLIFGGCPMPNPGQPAHAIALAPVAPRCFDDESIKSFLHVGVEKGDAAMYVVLDQEALVAQDFPNIVVGCGVLDQPAMMAGVLAPDTPRGPFFQQAWYNVVEGDVVTSTVRSIRVGAGALPDSPWQYVDERQAVLTDWTPGLLRLGAPLSRDLPVVPRANLGFVENLETGGRCALGGEVVAVDIAGPGPNSYTGFALRADSSELIVFNPYRCGMELPYSVGLGPVDVAVAEKSHWQNVFVASRDEPTVHHLSRDGTLTAIPLPPFGPFPHQSTALDIVRRTCGYKVLDIVRGDFDDDTFADDVRVEWARVGCGPEVPYNLQCLGTDQCYCDLDEPGCEWPPDATIPSDPCAPPPGSDTLQDITPDCLLYGHHQPWHTLMDEDPATEAKEVYDAGEFQILRLVPED